ncbi:MAG TPA: cyclase family protein [Dongiaceae bacterium]|nr:cyclase family protein [Dongiaceae bacterium]
MPATSTLAEIGLWPLLDRLRGRRWVDLTHTFSPATPHHPNFRPAEFRKIVGHDDLINGHRAGFISHEYRFAGQWGTHVDPPVHFHAGLRHQDEIPVEEMLLPLVVLDISRQAAEDPDYCVTLAELDAWENRWGRVPGGAFVALRSDWSKRWPDQARMMNRDGDGVCHYPGWSMPVLETLFEERGIRACGHETTDTDPGIAASRYDGTLESYVLGRNCWQIEMLANLDQVPEAGGMIVAAWPKAEKGSGFPVRAFAICPER